MLYICINLRENSSITFQFTEQHITSTYNIRNGRNCRITNEELSFFHFDCPQIMLNNCGKVYENISNPFNEPKNYNIHKDVTPKMHKRSYEICTLHVV